MKIERYDSRVEFLDTDNEYIGSIEEDTEGYSMYWDLGYLMSADDLRTVSREITNFVNRVIIITES
jgi:hypothetical protein